MWLTRRFRQYSFIKDSRHEVVSYLQENQEVLQKMQTK
jgi:hypothetical protein